MKDKFAVSMFGQKRLSREGGIEIVVKELCTRMARDGCQVTCYNRSGHHVSGAEYDNKIEYDGIRQKFVPTIERKGLAAVSSSFFAALYSAFGKYDVVHIHTKELWIDRQENSKSLAWSSVLLTLKNIKGEVVDRPKALGDIRGVTYIYGMFYRFGLIDVPDEVKEKMGRPKARTIGDGENGLGECTVWL